MTQAARSGRANLIEGSERAGTSCGTEIRLTDVARGSLGELKGDYANTVANAMLILLSRVLNMLGKQLAAQGQTFTKEGSFHERMAAARIEERDRQQADPTPPNAPSAANPCANELPAWEKMPEKISGDAPRSRNATAPGRLNSQLQSLCWQISAP